MRTFAAALLPVPRRSDGFILAAFAVACSLVLAVRAAEPKRGNEIIVSAANYAQASPDVLAKLFRHPADLVEAPRPPAGNRPVRYYQFLASESLDADLSFVDVCKLLVPVLAVKNLVNTTDAAKADLILRVTFGVRTWRDPFVRENDLAWRHGLVPKRRNTGLSADEAWDERSGGDESALYAVERELMEIDPAAQGMADSLIAGVHTLDYNLIVVDAFEVAALKKRGNDTPRAWSTFIAVPQRRGVKFSDIAPQMIAKAAPYFGETLPGKIHFTDREGTVKIKDLKVIDDKENAVAPKK